jgi:uncharacterized protein (TIGR02001 family)
VIVPAPSQLKLRRTCVVRLSSPGNGASGLLLLAALCLATPAMAEVGASVSILSEDGLRGHAVSRGRPVATLDLSYDDAGGVYLGGSATGVATANQGAQLLGAKANIGYARRFTPNLIVDVGIVHSRYTEYFSGGRAAHYTEAYVGLITDHFSSHIHYSPDYFRSGLSTIYADVEGVVRPASQWRLNAHLGLLTQTKGPRPPGVSRTHYDWRLGIARQAGAFDLQLALTGGGPDPDYYNGRAHSRTALVFGIVYTF